MKNFRKRQIVYLLLIFLLTAGSLSVPAYLLYQNAKNMIVNELCKNALNIANTCSVFIEQDINSFQKTPAYQFSLSKDGEETGDSYDYVYFNQIMKQLQNIKKITGAEDIYPERKLSDTQKAYIFNADNLPSRSPLTDQMSDKELLAFNMGVMSTTDVMKDTQSGEFIAGYAPIIDRSNGQIAGIIVVEFSLAYAQGMINNVQNIVLSTFLVIMLLTSFVVYRLIITRKKGLEKDYVTTLYDKRYFVKHLKKAVNYGKLHNRPLSLMMIDIDAFKHINDHFGHVAGDQILQSVAKVMIAHTRSVDICARYGGDELVIVLPNTNKEQTAVIAERIRKKISELDLCTEDNVHFAVTVSIGVAELSPHTNAVELMDCADKAMYTSKNTGKNKITVYENQEEDIAISNPFSGL